MYHYQTRITNKPSNTWYCCKELGNKPPIIRRDGVVENMLKVGTIALLLNVNDTCLSTTHQRLLLEYTDEQRRKILPVCIAVALVFDILTTESRNIMTQQQPTPMMRDEQTTGVWNISLIEQADSLLHKQQHKVFIALASYK